MPHDGHSAPPGPETRRGTLMRWGRLPRGMRAQVVRFLAYGRIMAYTTKPLTPATWDDFATLVESHNGVWGGCWCMGFHPEGVGPERTAEDNRAAKWAHTTAGTRQVLVYADDDCVGWCQFGTPAELPNIKNRKKYDRDAAEPPTWRIGCIFTASKHRGRGVARAAVGAALDTISRAGGGVVEAYPEQTGDRPAQRGAYLHTGPEELYEQFGFVRDRQIAKWRWVMRVELSEWHRLDAEPTS